MRDGSATTTSVTLNVAVDDSQTSGFLTVYPCGTERPWASNLNFATDQTISNHVTVTLGASAAVCLFASTTTHVVIDVEGVYRIL